MYVRCHFRISLERYFSKKCNSYFHSVPGAGGGRGWRERLGVWKEGEKGIGGKKGGVREGLERKSFMHTIQ